ncbi:MAG: D-alanyl-D-alanine carboxypeptidase family protein, partial [Bacillota bacterium]
MEIDNLKNTKSKQVKVKKLDQSKNKVDHKVFIGALKETDFVDISDIDSGIKQVKYFKSNKIFSDIGEEIIAQKYDIMALRLGTALKLSKANKKLRKKGYGILVYDAYRSYDVQNLLRNHYKYLYKKFDSKYISTPGFSNHQKGASVDIGLYNIETD